MTSHVEPTPREGPKALDQEDHSADQASGSCTGKSKIPDQHSNVYGRLCISPDSAHRLAHRRARTEHNSIPRRCDATGEGLVMGTGGGGQKLKTDGINRKESTKQKKERMDWRDPETSTAGERSASLRTRQRLCLDEGKRGEKVTSVTVAHCSIFRLFVVNIVLP